MSTNGNDRFEQSYFAGFGSVLSQLAGNQNLRERMTKTALSMALAASVAMTGAMKQAHAEDNGLVRFAKGTIGAVLGGAIGSQIGNGRGKTAATVAGSAAGVWAAEELGGNNNRPVMGNGGGYYGGSLSGPNVDYGPGGVRTGQGYNSGYYGGARSVPGREAAQAPSLNIGSTPLEADRQAKIVGMERHFLATRDAFARAQYVAEQAYDDVVLTPGNSAVQKVSADAQARLQTAMREYTDARGEFAKVVEHFGSRGYDVKQFAYSHQLAYTKVTSGDMNRRDTARAAQAAQDRYADRNNENMGVPSYVGL